MNGPSSIARIHATATALPDTETETTSPERQDLLPGIRALTVSGDMGAMITAMLLEAGRDGRKLARASQDAAMKAELAAQGRELEAMEDAAEQKLYGGVASGVATIAGSGLSIAGATASSETAGKAVTAAGKGAEGHGAVVKAGYDFAATDGDREAKNAESGAKQAGRQIDSARDDQREAADMIRRALDAYKQYVDTKDAAARATFLKA